MAKVKRYNPLNTSMAYKTKKGYLLYIFLAPLFLAIILALMQRNISAFILNLIAFGLFFATAKLNSFGLEKEAQYHQAKLTKAPQKPYKMMAGLLLGFSTLFTASMVGGKPLLIGIFLALISTVGYFLFYGFDPRGDKLENIGDISAELVLQTIKEAQDQLDGIESHMEKITNDPMLYAKLDKAVQKAQTIIDTLQEDPKDIRVARKFLIVYIDGLEKVTNSYTSMDEKEINSDTKTRLHQLLKDVEQKFDQELIRLKKNNNFDLDVKIDVLQEQIKN